MKILFPVSILDNEPETKENIRLALEETINETRANVDIDGYCVDISISHVYNKPATIKHYVRAWPAIIREYLRDQCCTVLNHIRLPFEASNEQDVIKSLKAAAKDALNEWSIDSNTCTILKYTTPYYSVYDTRCQIDDEHAKEILKHPEQYRIAKCTVKKKG